jgi:hypothetical protein
MARPHCDTPLVLHVRNFPQVWKINIFLSHYSCLLGKFSSGFKKIKTNLNPPHLNWVDSDFGLVASFTGSRNLSPFTGKSLLGWSWHNWCNVRKLKKIQVGIIFLICHVWSWWFKIKWTRIFNAGKKNLKNWWSNFPSIFWIFLRKFGNFPDFNLGTQTYNVGIYLVLQDTSSDFILFWKHFTTRQQKRPLHQVQRLFFQKQMVHCHHIMKRKTWRHHIYTIGCT